MESGSANFVKKYLKIEKCNTKIKIKLYLCRSKQKIMRMEKGKSTRGGRRVGAGRPRTDSQLFTFRAGGAVAQCINNQENKTDFIVGCIASKMEEETSRNSLKMSLVTPVEKIDTIGEVHSALQVKPLSIPEFDVKVVAGIPIPLDSQEQGEMVDMLGMLCPHPESSYFIHVKGDSMIDSDIHSGDVLIVDRSNRNPRENEVAMCELNGEYTVKFLHRHDNALWLVPANENYSQIKVSEEDSFNVWGVITYVIHKPRV